MLLRAVRRVRPSKTKRKRHHPEPEGIAYMALKKARRRREILVTAAAVFAEFGYFNATMKDIANRIGMRSGSLYHYLESKEAALEQICRDGAAEFCARLQTIADNGGPFAGIVEQGIRAHLTADRRDYVVSFAFNRRNLPAGVVDELNDMARAYRRIWVQIFRHGRDCGEWQSDIDPGVAADAVLSLCNGMAATLALKRGREVGQVVDSMAAVFLHGILGGRRSKPAVSTLTRDRSRSSSRRALAGAPVTKEIDP